MAQITIYQTFETERLFLTPTNETDAVFLLELLNSPKWLKYIGNRKVYTVEEARMYIRQKMLPQLEKLGFSNYTISRKTDGAKIGTCGLFDREGLASIDIGYAILPQYEKQGYAFEAANKIKEVAFSHFHLNEIVAITTKENIDSQRLLIKVGFQYVNMIRIPDDDEELMFFKLKAKKTT